MSSQLTLIASQPLVPEYTLGYRQTSPQISRHVHRRQDAAILVKNICDQNDTRYDHSDGCYREETPLGSDASAAGASQTVHDGRRRSVVYKFPQEQGLPVTRGGNEPELLKNDQVIWPWAGAS